LAFLAEALDPRIRSEEKLRAAFNLPLLGRLPSPPFGLRRRNKLVMMDAPTTPHAEAFRIMAANLEFVTLKSTVKTNMVTSALPREGKTTTVANLGVAFARQGRKIILIDFDAQSPSLHELFHLDAGPGLLDVALGRAGLDDALAQVNITELGAKANGAQAASVPPGTRPTRGFDSSPFPRPAGVRTNVTTGSLKILRAGEPTLDINAFLSSDMAAPVLSTIAQQADLVLIDSPPLLQSSSAVTLATEVDAILVVSRLKTLNAPALGELARVLADGFPARRLGFAVTNSDMPHPSYHASSYDITDARAGILNSLATIRNKQAER
jgi:Mrp family chromosome partitioning ATPase